MSGHHGPPDLDAQKDAQRAFTTDPHGPLGPLLPPPRGRLQERPHPGSPTPSPTLSPTSSPTPGHPPWVTYPGEQHQERLHPRSPTLGSTLLPAGQVSCGFSETQRRGVWAGSHLRDAYPLGLQSPAPRAPRPVLAMGVRPRPRGTTARDLLVSNGARRPRGPGGLGKAAGRRGIWWSWVPAVGGGRADPRPAQ